MRPRLLLPLWRKACCTSGRVLRVGAFSFFGVATYFSELRIVAVGTHSKRSTPASLTVARIKYCRCLRAPVNTFHCPTTCQRLMRSKIQLLRAVYSVMASLPLTLHFLSSNSEKSCGRTMNLDTKVRERLNE